MQTITVNESSPALRRLFFVCELSVARNEIQVIDLGNIATGHTFTLTFEGQTTAAITFAADMTTAITTALEALNNIAVGEATVVKGALQVYTVTFSGTHASRDLVLMTINSPTTFTPGGVTKTHGGIAGAPAKGQTFTAAQIQVSRNGGTAINSTGTVVEFGNDGRYYYIASAAEVDTLGFLSLTVAKTEIAVVYPTARVVASTVSTSSQYVGTAQAGSTADALKLDTGASALSNYYVPTMAEITAGTGAGQGGRLGLAYNGTTKVLTVEPAWVVVPDATSVFKLTATILSMADAMMTAHKIVGTFGGQAATVAEIGDAVIVRSDEIAAAFLDLPNGIETAITLRQAMRLIAAASAGKVSGGATTTVTIRNLADTLNRIVATVDADGNRTAITTNLT